MLAKDILVLVGLVKQAGLPTGRAGRMLVGSPSLRATQGIGEQVKMPWTPRRTAAPQPNQSPFFPSDQRSVIQGARPYQAHNGLPEPQQKLPQLPWWRRMMRQAPQRLEQQPW